jgi:hypothetical protein
MQRLLQTLDAFLLKAGLSLGTVTFYDVNAAAKAAYSSVNVDSTGPCDELSQLFTLSQPGNQLDVFLVDRIISATGDIVGMDGTIPGPSTFGGTIASGMVVSLGNNLGHEKVLGACDLAAPIDIGNCGDDVLAYITAHEAGHFMGLYHTTEEDGWFVDPVADTATCFCNACRSVSGTCYSPYGSTSGTYSMTAADCSPATAVGPSCRGADNLMFYSVTGSSAVSQGNLTPQQGQVMRANPVVQ